MNRNGRLIAAQSFLALALILAQAGCKKSENTAAAPETSPSAESGNALMPGTSEQAGLSAEQQTQGATDLALVRSVRQALVDDKALSMSAQNIKVVAVDGAVTLRGSVGSRREKDEVLATVKKVNGVKKIDDQLETGKAPGSRG